MRFAFSEDDDAIRDAVRTMLTTACPPAYVRSAWTREPGDLDRSVWNRLVEMGVPDLLVSEADGGLGYDERAIVQVLEEIGFAGVPLTIVESVLLAPAMFGASAHRGALFATDLGGRLVPMGADADILLLRADDGAVHAVPVAAVTCTPVSSTDESRRLVDVRWREDSSDVVCRDLAAIASAVDRATFGTATVLLGVLQRMLEMTVQHAKDRQQFGVPIGSFQAVKHHLADAHMAIAFARPAVYRAAWSLATQDSDCSRHVALAKLLVNQAAGVVTRHALQCHGAIGYTVEYDLHLFLKRAWALRAEWGGEHEQRARLAADLGLIAAQ